MYVRMYTYVHAYITLSTGELVDALERTSWWFVGDFDRVLQYTDWEELGGH